MGPQSIIHSQSIVGYRVRDNLTSNAPCGDLQGQIKHGGVPMSNNRVMVVDDKNGILTRVDLTDLTEYGRCDVEYQAKKLIDDIRDLNAESED